MLRHLLLLLLISSTFIACTAEDNSSNVYEDENVHLNITADDIKLINLVNQYRAEHDLDALQLNITATKEAKGHSDYMIAAKEISHENWDVRVENINKEEITLCLSENVARHYTVEEAFMDWLKAQKGHKESILGDFTHTGVGVIKSEDGFIYLTQIFVKK